MRASQYIDYIESGLGIASNGKQFRKIALAPCLWVLLIGLIPCVVLRGTWIILLFVMLATSLAITAIVFVISFRQLSIRSRLVMQSLIYSNFVMQLLMLETMFYLITWGADWGLILLLLVPILTPFVLGLQNANRLRKNQIISITGSRIYWFSFGWTGILGTFLAKNFFNEMSNKTAMLFIILGLSVLSCIFSVGLLSYQRLYFFKKYVE